MKTLTCIAAFGAALVMAHSAFAASALAKACAADIKAQCADVKPGGGKLKDCVKAHFSDLSADCQVAIVRAAAVGRACKADIKKFCADVKTGKGAIADCMKEHTADISDGCKDAMAKAEAGKMQRKTGSTFSIRTALAFFDGQAWPESVASARQRV